MVSNIVAKIIFRFNNFILFYVIAVNLIYLIQLILSALNMYKYTNRMKYSDHLNYADSDNMIPISVLVPAYNEQETIVDNIKSLLTLNYPTFEIIVINDGSKDETKKMVIEAFSLRKVYQPIRYTITTNKITGIYRNIDVPNLVFVDKENGGKADALNAGINISRYPVFASIDADSILEGDSLIRVIMPFIEDKNTIAVGGIVRVANGSTINQGKIKSIKLPQNRIGMFQIVEYLRAFLTGRMAWDKINSLLIISGAFGAFKKKSAIEVGGYTAKTIGEDMELVVKLHIFMLEAKREYKIKFIPDPVCWTQAPEKIKDLRVQRRRWQIGLMDSLFKHKEILFNIRFGKIGFLAAPYFFIFEMIGPVIEILGYIFIPLSFALGILNIEYFILFLMVSILFGIILSIGAILLEEYTFNKYPSLNQLFKLSLYGILENFGYRQLTTIFRLEGIIKFNKLKGSWGSIKRKRFQE